MNMVSTRGVKFKFEEGEKVLCYEPDPSKAKVLYEAKVLEVNTTKDRRGRKVFEYLIHFNGWNSSWDRYVSDTLILKDNDENRTLQRKLAEEAAINLKNKKKRQRFSESLLRSPSDKRKRHSSSYRSDTNKATDGGYSSSGSSAVDFEESTKECEENAAVEIIKVESMFSLPLSLRKHLEWDHCLITKKNKVVKLPCQPSVISILETYVKQSVEKLRNAPETSTEGNSTCDKSGNLYKEVVDGLRIYFDFTLPTLLLYASEKKQYDHIIKHFKHEPSVLPEQENFSVQSHAHSDSTTRLSSEEKPPRNIFAATGPPSPVESTTSPIAKLRSCQQKPPVKQEKQDPGFGKDSAPSQKQQRTLRSAIGEASPSNDSDQPDANPTVTTFSETSSSSFLENQNCLSPHSLNDVSQSNGANNCDKLGSESNPVHKEHSHPASRGSRSSSKLACINETPEMDINDWRLIPPDAYSSMPVSPSIVYGAHHLLRLFVKLPELLGKTTISTQKKKALCKHLKLFVRYLDENEAELFSDSVYIDAEEEKCDSNGEEIR